MSFWMEENKLINLFGVYLVVGLFPFTKVSVIRTSNFKLNFFGNDTMCYDTVWLCILDLFPYL